MAYALAGVVIGAILIRVFVLLKHQATEREQMAARLSQLAL
jgi:hypothetical protein